MSFCGKYIICVLVDWIILVKQLKKEILQHKYGNGSYISYTMNDVEYSDFTRFTQGN
jgi:hypothetical protein